MQAARRFLIASAGSLALTLAPGAQAHHSVSGQFDTRSNKTVTGVLTRVELINPHSYMHFGIKNAAGQVEAWSFETAAPLALKAAGISVRDTFKVGQTYQLVYSPARGEKSKHIGLLSSVVLPDGRMVAFGAKNNVDASRELTKKP